MLKAGLSSPSSQPSRYTEQSFDGFSISWNGKPRCFDNGKEGQKVKVAGGGVVRNGPGRKAHAYTSK